ncbi:ATP-dependent DNA helicase RecQ [Abditibacteriota bacterium]|nr:ATP-dependent DNA helicase RecQ [Abditibacteriota bacterium]
MTSPLDILQTTFGFSSFRAGQLEVVDEILNGSGRALAIFPTGAGKSLCYQLPALALDGTTLVVSPLLALMKDQIDFLHSRGVAAARLDSTQDAEAARAVADDLRCGRLKLLYVAPERFNNERFRTLLQSVDLSLFAIDEAHCISEWGHNFRPDYLKLARFVEELGVPRVLALTATATPKVARSICERFAIPATGSVNTGFYRPNLKLCLTPTPAARRHDLLLSRLQKRVAGSTVVYVTLQKTAEEVAQFLAAQGLEARAYHAGMESDARTSTQDWWMESDRRIVVATIAFGMGIDKSDVRYIYHFNLPKGLESYAQEIGRAGRDGKPAIVELFAARDDVPTLENFVYGDTPTQESLRQLVESLDAMGEKFALKENELSSACDLRSLVLRTALTYLELDGILKQGTPFYAGYDIAPLPSWKVVYEAFSPKASDFLQKLVQVSKTGRTWTKVDPDDASEKLGCPRAHVVRAVELLEQKNVAQVRASDVRHEFQRLVEEFDRDAIVAGLMEKFAARETGEIKRIGDVLRLVECAKCQTNALVGYFGEKRGEPCGHCSFCVSGRATKLPPVAVRPAVDEVVNGDELAKVQEANLEALKTPRQLARFLCGLSSPALSKARLMRHPMWGCLEGYRFGEVLSWCEAWESF